MRHFVACGFMVVFTTSRWIRGSLTLELWASRSASRGSEVPHWTRLNDYYYHSESFVYIYICCIYICYIYIIYVRIDFYSRYMIL